MNEDKDAEKKPAKKIEIKDFADEQKPEEQIDLSTEDQVLDDETIDEVIADENAGEVEESEQEVANSSITEDVKEDATENVENPEEAEPPEKTNEDIDDQEKVVEEKPTLSSDQSTDLEDTELNDAVDDIVREESDDVLVLDDAIKQPEEQHPKGLKKLGQKIKHGFSWWWNHTLVRNATIAFAFLGLVAISIIPVTRYAVLNVLGVRVESSMRIVDSETRLPLQNIRVSLQDTELKTDENGEVSFSERKLGSSELVIARRGYAETKETIVLGLGSNPLGDKSIVATGLQYSFVLRDWISDASITEASAISGEYTARADDTGTITLTLSEDADEDAEIVVKAAGYRDESFVSTDLTIGENTELYMVNDRKHLFVSNRDNRYDIFSIDLDGNNEEIFLEATGKERDIPLLYAHPARQTWALIGSHEGEKNAEDYILDGLYVIDTQNGDTKRVVRSERISIVGWSGDYLVFWQVVEGTSQGNPERSKLYSYNFVTGEREELAAANYFNDVELIDDTVYYAVSGFAVPESYARLFEVNVSGEQKVQVLDKQVYSIFRTGINDLLYSAANQEWFKQTLPDAPESTERRNSVPDNYTYVYSPSGESVSWVRVRDGQGVLQYQNLAEESQEQEAAVDAGIRVPLYWLGDGAIVYRVVKSGETADYLVSLTERPEGGDNVTKITNITIQTFNGY